MKYIVEQTNSWRYSIRKVKANWDRETISSWLKYELSNTEELQKWLDEGCKDKTCLDKKYNEKYSEEDLDLEEDLELEEDFEEDEKLITDKKALFDLVWQDWNSFFLMWAFRKAAKDSWFTNEEIAKIIDKCKSWTYDELLQTIMLYSTDDKHEVSRKKKAVLKVKDNVELSLTWLETNFEWIEKSNDKFQKVLDRLYENVSYEQHWLKWVHISFLERVKSEHWNLWAFAVQYWKMNYQVWNWWFTQYFMNWFYREQSSDWHYTDENSFNMHEEYITSVFPSIIKEIKESWKFYEMQIYALEKNVCYS